MSVAALASGKARLRECAGQVVYQIGDLQLARQFHQRFVKIELRRLAVKEIQHRNQRRGQDQRLIRELVGIADQQAWAFFHRAGHEVQIHS